MTADRVGDKNNSFHLHVTGCKKMVGCVHDCPRSKVSCRQSASTICKAPRHMVPLSTTTPHSGCRPLPSSKSHHVPHTAIDESAQQRQRRRRRLVVAMRYNSSGACVDPSLILVTKSTCWDHACGRGRVGGWGEAVRLRAVPARSSRSHAEVAGGARNHNGGLHSDYIQTAPRA